MNLLVSLVAVGALFAVGWAAGAAGMGFIVGVVVPYLAVAVFVGGLIYRVLAWVNVPVPFRIPTTCGQQKSLDWIGHDRLENPHSGWDAFRRMAIEVLFFRSLLRNTRTDLVDGRRLVYATDLTLWLGAMAMHWSMLIILTRHLRLMVNPVPGFVTLVERIDGFLEIGLPVVYITSLVFGAALLYLLGRRLVNPQVRYISLVGDYFPLLLLIGIGTSGFLMRHVAKTDIAGIKELLVGLTRFSPVVPDGISPLFFGHVFLVSVLLLYFPFSKLVHMPGVFLSPTRNLANNNRAVRHVNPWDYPVTVHTYEDYEDELREKMTHAGIPVERS